jgi:hypothetical protein
VFGGQEPRVGVSGGRTVLWGRRRGEIQFGSLDDWRRHIPVGAEVLVVESTAYFDVGDYVEPSAVGASTVVGWVVGIEAPDRLGMLLF